MRLGPLAPAALLLLTLPTVATRLRAQSNEPQHADTATTGTTAVSRTASDERPPRLSYGTAVGGMSFRDGHSAQALKGVVQFQATPWLVLSSEPAFVRATDTTGLSAQKGLTDLPLAAGVMHADGTAPWHPSVGLTGIVSLPTGDAKVGLGTGQVELSADAALDLAPRDGLDLRFGAWHALTHGAGAASGLRASSLGAEASWDVGEKASVDALYDTDLGARDSTWTPARAVGAGASFALSGPLTLTVQATHALAGDGPRWAMSVGFGTAFAGISPVGATSPLSRMRGAFAGRSSGTGGRGSCRASRSC